MRTAIVLVAVLVGCKQAEAPIAVAVVADGAPMPAVPNEPLKRALLWTATRDGKVTHILGTIHSGIQAKGHLPRVVWEKFAAAPVFAMETDPDKPATMGRRSSGTLRDDLGPVYWRKLEASVGTDVAASLVNTTPSVAATMLASRGLPHSEPMDGTFHALAKYAGKRIVALQSAAELLASYEVAMSARRLKLMLDDPDGATLQNRLTLEAYISGDDEALARVIPEDRQRALAHGMSAADYDASIEALLDKRNAAWIPAIEKLHGEGGGFVAVGALHLVGERGLVELLVARGFTVSR